MSSDTVAIVNLLQSDPSLCARVAAAVDERTALHWAVSRERGNVQDPERDPVPRPSMLRIRLLFVRTAVPFVGFGFFDNMIMLTVGETLDVTLGVIFGFSTLAAAGMGQMVSDSAGITLQGLIERYADKLGLPDPGLTGEERGTSFVQTVILMSKVVGIVSGCALGMFPLLAFPEKQYSRCSLVDEIAADLPVHVRTEFLKVIITNRFKKGEKLLSFNEISGHVHLIQSGRVEVVGRDFSGVPFTVCTMGQGHAFGQPELDLRARVDLVAMDDEVVVQSITKEDYLRLTGSYGIEVFEKQRSPEHKVYFQTQGQSGQIEPRPQKGTGKTRFFASLSDDHKLEVLSCVENAKIPQFQGEAHEGKTAFFANLSEEQKCQAVLLWRQRKLEQVPETAAA